jgi:FkbM family methyltransferase
MGFMVDTRIRLTKDPLLNVRALDIIPMGFGFVFGTVVENAGYLIDTIKTTSNWHDALLVRFGMKSSAELRFRNGRRMLLDKPGYPIYGKIRYALSRGLPISFTDGNHAEFSFGGRRVALAGENVLFNVLEVFIDGAYASLDCSGRVVVDAGANIGDTAIFFALRGAERVFALEPFRNLYLAGKENVSANNLADKVTFLNCALSSWDGTAPADPDSPGTIFTRFEAADGGAGNHPSKKAGRAEGIPVLTLKRLTESYGIADAVLKMDCEGAEYAILLNSDVETLRVFSQMLLEFHYGYLDLAEKLESAGFKVKIISGPKFLVPGGSPSEVIGMLHATRL